MNCAYCIVITNPIYIVLSIMCYYGSCILLMNQKMICFVLWQWLDEWPTHERVELLSEVVKCCDEESLNFFAQCLTQR